MTRRKKWLVIIGVIMLLIASAGAVGGYWIYHEIKFAAAELMQKFQLDPKDFGSDQFKTQLAMAAECMDADTQESLKGCTALIDQGNKSPVVYRQRGSDFVTLKQYDKGIQDYATAFQLDPKSTPPDVIRGEIEDTNSDSAGTRSTDDKAISYYSSAIEHAPTSSEAYLHRGADYLEHSQYDLALADFNHGIQNYTDDTPAFEKTILGPDVLQKGKSLYYLRGFTHQKKAEYDLAIDDFNHALKLDNGCCTAPIYKSMQFVYFLKGDFPAAVENGKKAVHSNPADADNVIWLHLARIRAGQDDKREFEKNIEALKPDNPFRPVLDYFSGKVTADVWLQNSSAADLCPKNFYIGESMLAKHDDKGLEYLHATDRACPDKNGYRVAADAELARTTAATGK